VYTSEISIAYLAGALVIWAALLLLNRPFRVMALWPYLLGGAAMWVCLLNAGIHASIAGVMLAFAIPFTAKRPDASSPSQKLMHSLHHPVAFVILPLFALANTGVVLDAESIPRLAADNSLGIALGLLLGKPLGVLLLSSLAVAAGLCSLPTGVRWPHMAGAGLIGGIGFTMSIFITNLAFASDPTVINDSKLAVLLGSLLAGLLGFAWLKATLPKTP
jgi:NhaA family Na+:H+ antiporter